MGGPSTADPHWPVRPVSPDEVPSVAGTLARAFYGDLFWKWFMPDDATRLQRLTLMFATLTRSLYLRHGNDCYTTDAYEGAALWAPPGHEEMSTADVLRVLPGWVRAIGLRDLLRTRRGTDSLDKVHPHERHYYLPFVGVIPEAQGGGLGTALIRPVLEKCDRDQIPAYLEATSTSSRRCYERTGFEVCSEERLAGDGPPFWPMWRSPAS